MNNYNDEKRLSYGEMNYYNGETKTLSKLLFNGEDAQNKLIEMYKKSGQQTENELLVVEEPCDEVSLRLVRKRKYKQGNIIISSIVESKLIMKSTSTNKKEMRYLNRQKRSLISALSLQPVYLNSNNN